jgi:hypothetical protein
METISFFASGGWLAGSLAIFYIIYPNRIKAINFMLYMVLVLMINGFLKNAYY